ncbi:MAG: O-antigen ligase family protein [bacterium]|nr:O-antigen ligase family protein [bacterium]
MNFFSLDKTFRLTIWISLLAFLLSWLVWYQPGASTIVFWLIVATVVIFSWWKLELGLMLVLAELCIGSKGYLFSWTLADLTISIRLAIFLTVVLIWALKYFRPGKVEFRSSSFFWWYIGFLAVYVVGLGLGWLNSHPGKDIFLDANGYLYFGLIFPIYHVIRDRAGIKRLVSVMLGATTALGIKTLALLFAFAGQYSVLPELYRWARDTRLDEITLITHNVYRVFSQAHIYAFFVSIITLVIGTLLFRQLQKREERLLWGMFLISTLTVLISYSRTFWLSLGLTLLVILATFVIRYQFTAAKMSRLIGVLLLVAVLEAAFVVLLVNLPNWLRSGGGGAVSLSSLVEERLGDTEQAGLQSRMKLLEPLASGIIHHPILGVGFGGTVSYQTDDPRIVAETGGLYTTYSFEWGYLDIWYKLGFVGLALYILFLWRVAQKGLAVVRDRERDISIFALAWLMAFLGLVVIHMTTPYLNHPLGIGFVMLSAVIFERLGERNTREHDAA